MENDPIPPRTFYRETLWALVALYGFALAGVSIYRAISAARTVPSPDYVTAFETRIGVFRPDLGSASVVRFYNPPGKPVPDTSDQLRFMMTQYVLAPVPLTWRAGAEYGISLAPDDGTGQPVPEAGSLTIRRTGQGDLLIKRPGEPR